jgi:hypothetical protein
MLLLALLACGPGNLPVDPEETATGPVVFETADDVLLGWVATLSRDAASYETDAAWTECPIETASEGTTTFTTGCFDHDGYAWTGSHTVTESVVEGAERFDIAWDTYGWDRDAASVRIDGALAVTFLDGNLDQVADVTVRVGGTPARGELRPTFALLTGAAHVFEVSGWHLAGGSLSRAFGADVTVDAERTFRAEGVFTLGGDTACEGVTAFELDLEGENAARAYFDSAEGCECVTFEIDGVWAGESCD